MENLEEIQNIELNSMQTKAFDAIFNDEGLIRADSPSEVAIFGGYGNGKSFVVMLITFLICFNYPGTKWIFCRAVGKDLRDTSFLQFKDKFLFPGINESREQSMEIRFDNGSTILFRAFDNENIRRILSSQYDGASLCQAEEVAKDLFVQLFGRLRGNSLPKRILLTEGNPDDTWPKERYKSSEGLPKGCIFLEAPTHVNVANVREDYIERMLDEFPAEYVDRYIYGNWDKTSNRVYTSYNQAMHVINPIPIQKHWFKAVGFDHGSTNPSAMVYSAVDEKGNIYIYDEYYEAGASISDLRDAGLRHGTFPIPADYSMKKGERDFGSLWSDLVREGLNLIEARKSSKAANILLVNQMFHQNRLFIFNTCVETIKEHSNYRWMKPKLGSELNRKEEVIKKDDHTCDALQYVVRYLRDIKAITQEEANYNNTFDYAVKHQGNTFERRMENNG